MHCPLKSKFEWTPEVQKAFERLEELLTTAYILTLPGPNRQLIVEVEASNMGLGALLSQRAKSDHNIHPYAFFSCWTCSVETNYNIGDRDFLAMNLALEEWQHWREGTEHPKSQLLDISKAAELPLF